jgi:hypothetical protein
MKTFMSRIKELKHIETPHTPKKCPRGHLHISWSLGDKHVFCWDCDQKYPVSECLDTRLAEASNHSPSS